MRDANGLMIIPVSVTETNVSIPVVIDDNTIIPASIVEANVSFPAGVEELNYQIPVGIDSRIVVNNDYYTGNYTVEPSANQDIVLPTAHKVMREDVTVVRIPVWETSNVSGGTTFYIARS